MPKFYNTNDVYGDPGPFEAASKEALADERSETFIQWAKCEWNSDIDSLDANTPEEHHEKAIARMRKKFIDGLEEV